MRIRLTTRDHQLVREGELPRYQPPPEVITWGSRVFVNVLAFHPTNANDEPVVYIEGLLYTLEVADVIAGFTGQPTDQTNGR